MTEMQARRVAVDIMIGWIGLSRSKGTHKVIIDTYNKYTPKPTSYKVTYKDEYCATGVSAAAIKAGYTDIIPLECSCGRMIELFIKMGRWVENDAYVPQTGDVLFYDWHDNGVGDNKGWADHVGYVEKVVGDTIILVECNINGGNVDRTSIKINAKNIRGFGIPDYSKKVTEEVKVEVKPEREYAYIIGDIVTFTGDTHYTSSYNTGKAVKCTGGLAKVTAISKNDHKYHIVSCDKKCTVHGWVDAEYLEPYIIKVGDIVNFTGNCQYKDSVSKKKYACTGGLAKVTSISKNTHKYHLISTENKCSVHGWVDAEFVVFK